MSRLYLVEGRLNWQDEHDTPQAKEVRFLVRGQCEGDAHMSAENQAITDLLLAGIEDVYRYCLKASITEADETWYELTWPQRWARLEQMA